METGTLVEPTLPQVFRAVVCTVVPEASVLDDDGWAELESLVTASLADRPAALRRQLRLFLGVIRWLPVLRYGRTFTALDAGQRSRFLAGLQSSRIDRLRVGFWGLRTLALLGFYGRASAGKAIGYRPNLQGWEAWR
jgi:hypothetical protein